MDKLLKRALVARTLVISFCAGSHAIAEAPISVALIDIDSGLTSPQGSYRWMDVADQLYDVDASTDGYSYKDDYDYTQAAVQVDFFTGAETLHGTLTATHLKPNFVYQFKLVGEPGTESNELIGFTGRWWQQEWTGTDWNSGWNLNNKGDGSWPNPNDLTYCQRRDEPDPYGTSPTGKRYKYTAYLVFDYFITDEAGDATLSFDADNSYHVLWKLSQRQPGANDGPIRQVTFSGGQPDPVNAYDTIYPETTEGVFGEWERLPADGVRLPAGHYDCHFLLTEESFHGGGLAGGWAAAMGAPVSFDIVLPTGWTFADFDGDGDFDHDDYDPFPDCLCGPGSTPKPACPVTSQACRNVFDADGDGDVDLHDFARSLASYVAQPARGG